MDALKLRKDVSKPGVVRKVFDQMVGRPSFRSAVFHRSVSDVGSSSGVSGEARLAVAV